MRELPSLTWKISLQDQKILAMATNHSKDRSSKGSSAVRGNEDQVQYFESLLPKPEWSIKEQNMFQNIFWLHTILPCWPLGEMGTVIFFALYRGKESYTPHAGKKKAFIRPLRKLSKSYKNCPCKAATVDQDISYLAELPNGVSYYSPEGTTLRTNPESSQIYTLMSVNTAHTQNSVFCFLFYFFPSLLLSVYCFFFLWIWYFVCFMTFQVFNVVIIQSSQVGSKFII